MGCVSSSEEKKGKGGSKYNEKHSGRTDGEEKRPVGTVNSAWHEEEPDGNPAARPARSPRPPAELVATASRHPSNLNAVSRTPSMMINRGGGSRSPDHLPSAMLVFDPTKPHSQLSRQHSVADASKLSRQHSVLDPTKHISQGFLTSPDLSKKFDGGRPPEGLVSAAGSQIPSYLNSPVSRSNLGGTEVQSMMSRHSSRYSLGGSSYLHLGTAADNDVDFVDAESLSVTSQGVEEDSQFTSTDTNQSENKSGNNNLSSVHLIDGGAQTPKSILGFFNPYDELQSKIQQVPGSVPINSRKNTGIGGGGSNRNDGGVAPAPVLTTGISNLSSIIPRPPSEIKDLKRNYDGGINHPTIPALYLPSYAERCQNRFEEVSSWNTEQNPAKVDGLGLLLFHPLHANEPLPIEAFKKNAPKYDTRYFVGSCSAIRQLLDEERILKAIALAEALEAQATAQRLVFVNSLFKHVSVKLRDLSHLITDKKAFLNALRECDVEGFRATFKMLPIAGEAEHPHTGSYYIPQSVLPSPRQSLSGSTVIPSAPCSGSASGPLGPVSPQTGGLTFFGFHHSEESIPGLVSTSSENPQPTSLSSLSAASKLLPRLALLEGPQASRMQHGGGVGSASGPLPSVAAKNSSITAGGGGGDGGLTAFESHNLTGTSSAEYYNLAVTVPTPSKQGRRREDVEGDTTLAENAQLSQEVPALNLTPFSQVSSNHSSPRGSPASSTLGKHPEQPSSTSASNQQHYLGVLGAGIIMDVESVDSRASSRESCGGGGAHRLIPTGYAGWLRQTIKFEIQYALLVTECFLRESLTEDQKSRHGPWVRPPPINMPVF